MTKIYIQIIIKTYEFLSSHKTFFNMNHAQEFLLYFLILSSSIFKTLNKIFIKFLHLNIKMTVLKVYGIIFPDFS
jgi:hypothetical protein